MVSAEGGAAERRSDGGVKLAGVRWTAAVVFLGLGLGNRKTNEGNGLQGYLQCSSAREIEGWGSAASSPRRRRCGGREEVQGGVAKGGGSSSRRQWVQKLVEAPREAEAKLDLAGGVPARRAGGARHRR